MKQSPLLELSQYWRKQAKLWEQQEKDWHNVVLFCRKIKEEMIKKYG